MTACSMTLFVPLCWFHADRVRRPGVWIPGVKPGRTSYLFQRAFELEEFGLEEIRWMWVLVLRVNFRYPPHGCIIDPTG